MVEEEEWGTALLRLFHGDGGFKGSRFGGQSTTRWMQAAANEKGGERFHHSESSGVSACHVGSKSQEYKT